MLTYRSYLHLDSLLDLQRPVGPSPASPELLFITVHQVYELWFKMLLGTLEDARDALLDGQIGLARRPLARAHTLQRLCAAQVELLETMTPREFADFRDELGSASGMQSAQHHELEIISAAGDERILRAGWFSDAERARLARRFAEPTLWDGYLAALDAAGLCTGTEGERADSLEAVAAEKGAGARPDVQSLTEDLRTYDVLGGIWRLRHAQLAERHIGGRPGTGGTAGAAYLRRRVDRCYFPELWGKDAHAAVPTGNPDLQTAR